MRLFSGLRSFNGDTKVDITHPNGTTQTLAPREELWPVSKSFDWATIGDEAVSLGLSLLHEATGAKSLSLYFAEMFAKQVVSSLPPLHFNLTESQILTWVIHAVEEELFPTASLFDKATQEEIANG